MMLGKRKRDAAVISRQAEKDESRSPSPGTVDAHALLRKHFESRFEPLEQTVPQHQFESESSSSSHTDEEDNSDWDGISDDDENPTPEVVEHTDSYQRSKDEVDKSARKEFMTAKPPSSARSSNKPKTKPAEDGEPDDQDAEAANLQNDLALQRLLKESHLLDSSSDLNPMGKNRHRAVDMRIQSMGANSSLYKQKNMPMSQRKGIEAKAAYRDEKRRREARENGIILEKPVAPSSKKKKASERRERGIGGPSVGKFARGTLQLSKKDVADIQGPKRSGRKGKGNKGRKQK